MHFAEALPIAARDFIQNIAGNAYRIKQEPEIALDGDVVCPCEFDHPGKIKSALVFLELFDDQAKCRSVSS